MALPAAKHAACGVAGEGTAETSQAVGAPDGGAPGAASAGDDAVLVERASGEVCELLPEGGPRGKRNSRGGGAGISADGLCSMGSAWLKQTSPLLRHGSH